MQGDGRLDERSLRGIADVRVLLSCRAASLGGGSRATPTARREGAPCSVPRLRSASTPRNCVPLPLTLQEPEGSGPGD